MNILLYRTHRLLCISFSLFVKFMVQLCIMSTIISRHALELSYEHVISVFSTHLSFNSPASVQFSFFISLTRSNATCGGTCANCDDELDRRMMAAAPLC